MSNKSVNSSYTRRELTDKVKKVIHEKLGINMEQITDDASYIDNFGIDCLDNAMLIMEFEEEFGVTIPEEDAEKLTTVSGTIDYLCKVLEVSGQTSDI